MRPPAGRLAVIALAVIVLDQVTKVVALARLRPGVPVPVWDGLVALTLVLNPGIAFGLLAGVPTGWRWTVALLSLAALLVLLRIAMRVLPTGGAADQVAIGLVFGGAVGNLIDRGRFGAVVDFVDVFWRGWHWPAFNVADSAITVGVALLAFRLLTEKKPGPG
ncbi:MAG: signal peptidase II [Candidatus Rokubacteria bacterium RBG_16_73_20]|nr:MAG: signal peptidase II [Candidatus Rokubacteria bacterium RBG_16_73_20]HBH04126.1 signal peptidase II [Candidatus Rokubacteria bacterium]